MIPRAAWAILLLVVGVGCSGNAASHALRAPVFDPAGQSKCSVVKSQARPLIVEWPSADRAALEAQAKRGIVAVRYEGCTMEVLRHCRGAGRYAYTPTTRQHDHIAIRDTDELYANIPLGAAKLEGKLASAGQLDVTMTIVGTYEADSSSLRPDQLEGECAGATHVMTALSAGAFQFFAGADAEIGAGASAVAVGAAGGKSKAKRETLNEAGDAGACEKASAGDTTPPFGCGALLRIEVVPLGGAKTAVPTCAAGTVWDGHQCARAATPTLAVSAPPLAVSAPPPAVSAPPPALPGGAPIVCLLGTHWEGSRCVPDPVQACGDKHYYEPGKGCQRDYPGCPHGSHYGGTNHVCALNHGVTPDDLYRRAEAARGALPIYGHRDYCRLLTAHFANDRHVVDCMYFDAVENLTRGEPLDAERTLSRSLQWPDGDHAPEVLLSLIQLHEQPDFKRRGISDVSDLVSRLRTRYPQSAAAKAIAGQ